MRISHAGVNDAAKCRFEEEIKSAINGYVIGTITFDTSHETVGEVSVSIVLEKDEKLTRDIMPLVSPIIDRLATASRNARCAIGNGGPRPHTTWHRWPYRSRE